MIIGASLGPMGLTKFGSIHPRGGAPLSLIAAIVVVVDFGRLQLIPLVAVVIYPLKSYHAECPLICIWTQPLSPEAHPPSSILLAILTIPS